jgi:type I restriction enzyme S subunit
VIFTQRGTLGQVAIVPSTDHEMYVVSQSQMRLRVDTAKTTPEFVYYSFCLPRIVDLINSRAIATGVPHINLGILGEIAIAVPPIDIQNAITSVLTAVDDKIAANNKLAQRGRQLGRALLIDVIGGATSAQRVDDLQRQSMLAFGDGYRTKRSELGQPGLGILRVADIGDGTVDAAAIDFVSSQYRAAIGQKTSRPNDVIVSTKGTVGRVAIIPEEMPESVYSPQVCYFRVSRGSPVTPAYLWFWFQSDRFISQAALLKSQTDMADYINLSDIGSLTIDIPGPDDVGLLGALDSLLALFIQAHGESRSLAAIRDTLLPRLMSGEIRVREAEKAVEEAL